MQIPDRYKLVSIPVTNIWTTSFYIKSGAEWLVLVCLGQTPNQRAAETPFVIRRSAYSLWTAQSRCPSKDEQHWHLTKISKAATLKRAVRNVSSTDQCTGPRKLWENHTVCFTAFLSGKTAKGLCYSTVRNHFLPGQFRNKKNFLSNLLVLDSMPTSKVHERHTSSQVKLKTKILYGINIQPTFKCTLLGLSVCWRLNLCKKISNVSQHHLLDEQDCTAQPVGLYCSASGLGVLIIAAEHRLLWVRVLRKK